MAERRRAHAVLAAPDTSRQERSALLCKYGIRHYVIEGRARAWALRKALGPLVVGTRNAGWMFVIEVRPPC